MSNVREQWSSKASFILAAAGSAVGLGNIWKFPYIAGENGGAAFLFIYMICIVMIGLPILNIEILLGRATQKNPVGAFKALSGKPFWTYVGALGVLASFTILSFYSVVGGWSIAYTIEALKVGRDGFHHTFFEMLGNWSFGDYYKKEAIQWSWELFTDIWKLDKERLWVTVFEDDDEAYELWEKETDIDKSRIIRSGAKDNFWEMAETGPCGPCSEIHYYVGDNPDTQKAKYVNNSDEYWELWNLVFIQSNRLKDGTFEDLPKKHVDTGAGLERICSVLQNKNSNYKTDLFEKTIFDLEKISNTKYDNHEVSYQVICDHLRTKNVHFLG